MSQKSTEMTTGHGNLPMLKIHTPWSTAEVYPHGAHVTHFQINGEPPLIFISRNSHFADGEAIRGGVPVCFPWFGPREGGPAHGLARILTWDLAETAVAPEGRVTVRLQLPRHLLKPEWSALRTEFVVTVADTLAMELVTTNESADGALEIENCLHTYFHVGKISAVSIYGLESFPFDDFASGAGGVQSAAESSILKITKETNRVYPNHTGAVEIRDDNLKRTIRVEKSNSNSTIVWNPWTTQKLPDDFDLAEHQNMVCVESGNVKQNRVSLAPGGTTALKVVLNSRPLTEA